MANSARRKIATAVLAMLVTATYADNENISVVTANGTTSFDIESVGRIDFSEAGITVVSTDNGETTFAFEEIRKIVFSETETGIQPQTVVRKSKLTLTLFDSGRQLRVNGWTADKATELTVFALTGERTVQKGGWNGETVDISSLPHGVYVVKVGNEVAKFRK